MREFMLNKEIIDAFEVVNIPLTKTNDRKGGGSLWWFEGGSFSVTLYTSINGLGKVGVFGHYRCKNGNDYNLTSCMCNWLVDFGSDLTFMAKGESLPW